MADTGTTVPSGKLLLEVVTPDKLLVSEYVDQISAPGTEGDFGGVAGPLSFSDDPSDRRTALSYWRSRALHVGVVGIRRRDAPQSHHPCRDRREKAEDIDVERAQASVAQAEERLERGGLPSEVEEARVSLEKARLRQKVAERLQKQGHA